MNEQKRKKNEKNELIEITKHSHKNSTGTFVCYNKRSFWFCTFFLLLNARANKMFDLALTKTNNFLFLHFSMNIYSKMNCAESKNQPLILFQNEETNSVDYGWMENKKQISCYAMTQEFYRNRCCMRNQWLISYNTWFSVKPIVDWF